MMMVKTALLAETIQKLLGPLNKLGLRGIEWVILGLKA